MKIRMTSTPPKRVGWHVAPTALGKLLIGKTEDGFVCRVGFLTGREINAVLADWKKSWPGTEFFAQKKTGDFFDAPVLLAGTPFQGAVWKVLSSIPAGKTLTYGALAKRIGNPGAVRAVGRACGANPVPVLIPCHRVVSANGLGGFSGGLSLKKALLKAEERKKRK